MNFLIEALLALVIAGLAMFYALPALLNASVQPAQNDAGNQIAQMQAAGAAYIKIHFASLISAIPVGGAQAVTPGALTTDGELPASFNNGNVFGQQHILVIAQTAAGALDAMVFTYGGDTIPDDTAIRVAEAGPANATVVLSSDPTNFEGAAGGQTVPAATFAGAGYAIAAGHIGAHIEPAAYAAEAPFLNRYATGNVDDNTMHTDLNMGANSIANAANVTASGVVTAGQKVVSPTLADPGGIYAVTPAGTSNIVNLTAAGTVTATQFLYPP